MPELTSDAQTFNAIPLFVCVVQQHSFSQAGAALGISKSAVSKRISLLEQHLGVRLFQRSTRKLSLTEAGQRFYQHALQALAHASQAQDAVAELQDEPRGVLKLLLPMTIGRLHIAPLIAQFLQQYPQLEVDLTLDDKAHNLIEQGYDLAVQAGELADSNLIARPLAPLKSVVCVAPDYFQKHQTQLQQPQQLAGHNCVVFSYSTNATFWQFRGQTKEQRLKAERAEAEWIEVKVQGNFRVNNSAAQAAAIIAGLGVGRLPTFIASEHIRKGELLPLFRDYQMPTKPLQLIYPQREFLPAKVKVLRDFLLEHLTQPDWDEF